MSSDIPARVKSQSEGLEGPAERGNLIVVSAPSGAGKSSLAGRVLKRVEDMRFSISYTTRELRGTEQNAVDYYFVSPDDFHEMQVRDEFLESAEVHGHLYGTHEKPVEDLLSLG